MIHTLAVSLAWFLVTITAPAGCEITHRFEDGSATAICDTGETIARDPDGREAGPWGIAHEAGQWYEAQS